MPAPISREDLQAAVLDGSVTLVDALPALYYERSHLPGAVNLVESDVAAQAAALLPDKAAPIVTYCSNEACRNSGNVARLLERAGYTDVRTYEAGIQDWVAAGLPVEGTGPLPG